MCYFQTDKTKDKINEFNNINVMTAIVEFNIYIYIYIFI